MAIILNDNIDTRAPKPTDNRFGPYTTTAAALEGIPEYQRYVGLTVGVGTPIKEYWFTTISTLEEKKSSGNVGGISAGTGIDITGTETLTIAVTTPTQLTTNISTNVITDQSSDTKYPSVKATKAYVDSNVAGLLDDRGNFPATSGDYPQPPRGSGPSGAIRKGDLWFISASGNLGTNAVGIGASVRALVDDAGATTDADWDILDTGLGFTPENVNNKVTDGSSITSDPTSLTKYASLKALTEYLTSIPASTPTLQQVLAVTPDQTSTGYAINLQDVTVPTLKTTVGLATLKVENVSPGDSITVIPASMTIASTGKNTVFTSDSITFTNSSNKTLAIEAVANNNTVTLPNQNATLIASVNSSIFADASTGNITIPYVGGAGTENFITKWDSSGESLTNSIVQQVSTNNIQIGGSSVASTTLDLFSFDRVDFRMYPYSTTTDYFGIYSYGPTGYGTSYTQIGLNDGITSNQQGGALYLDTRGSLPPLSLMVKDNTTNAMTYALSIATSGKVGIGTTTPEYKLDIIDTTISQPLYARFTNEANSNKNAITFGKSTSAAMAMSDSSGVVKILIGDGVAGFANFITYNNNIFNFSYSTAVGGAQLPSSLVKFTPDFIYSTGTNSHTILDINPNINVTGGTNTLRGVYYNPNSTAGTITTEIAFENTQGNNIFNTNSGSSYFKKDVAIDGDLYMIKFKRLYIERTSTGSATGLIIDGNHGFDGSGVTENIIKILSSDGAAINPVANTNVYNLLNLNPKYEELVATYSGASTTLRGYYYSPDIVGTPSGLTKHIAFENVNGNVLLGTTSGNVGIKNNNPQYTLDLEGSANFKLTTNTPATPYLNKLSVRNGVLRLGFTLGADYAFRYIQFTDETDQVENFMFGATKGLYNPSLSISNPANTAINNPVIAMAQKDALYIMSGAASQDSLGDKTALVIKKDGRVKYRPLSSEPTTNVEEGDTYYDSTLQKLRVYTASGWQNLN